MMLDLNFTLNLLTLAAIVFFSVLIGWLIRYGQLSRKDRRIAELEKEMIQAHAELLDQQKEYCEMEGKMRDLSIPVISIKTSKTEELPGRTSAGS
jgi:hypothetical protein